MIMSHWTNTLCFLLVVVSLLVKSFQMFVTFERGAAATFGPFLDPAQFPLPLEHQPSHLPFWRPPSVEFELHPEERSGSLNARHAIS